MDFKDINDFKKLLIALVGSTPSSNPIKVNKFPYETFPWRMEYNNVVYHFQDESHLRKIIDRYNIKPKNAVIEHKHGESFVFRKKYKKKIVYHNLKHQFGISTRTLIRKKNIVMKVEKE